MIRRSLPLNTEDQSWLMITQVEHARISHQLAKAWRGLLDNTLQEAVRSSVRDELLAAVLHHDDGWLEWDQSPEIDPKFGRPYGFTEMPADDSQAIWSRSICACRAIGPLAGWVVASHFVDLQSKQDDDFHLWSDWLDEQNRTRAEWLQHWLAADIRHTRELADACLCVLQTFDWLSLWLCCRAPISQNDPHDSLELADASRKFGPYQFTPDANWSEKPETLRISVDPWPFTEAKIEVHADAVTAPACRYRSSAALSEQTKPTSCAWSLYCE